MPLSYDALTERFSYLKICLNELEDWLDSDPSQELPHGYTRIIERLYQIVVDEIVGICRWYLSDETDMAPTERTARKAVESIGRDAWIEPETLARFLRLHLDLRNRLVHTPEARLSENLEEAARWLVRDAQRFYRSILFGFCPACDTRLRINRAPTLGSLGRCTNCGQYYRVDHSEPVILTAAEAGEILAQPVVPAEPDGPIPEAPARLETPADPSRDLPGEPPVSSLDVEAQPAPQVTDEEQTAGEPPAPELLMEAAPREEDDADQPAPEALPETPAEAPEPIRSAWETVYLQALELYRTALATRKGFPEAQALFYRSVELGGIPAYRSLGVMARLAQGSKVDLEQAIKQFNKGIKNNDGRCHAELALLFAQQGDRARAQAKWKDYFHSQAFIRNQTYAEPELDRSYYAVQYLLYALEDPGEIPFWDKAGPYAQDALTLLQSQNEEDRKSKDKDRFGRLVRRKSQMDRLTNLIGAA